MSDLPQALFYTKTHEWAQADTHNTSLVTVGITEYAQQLLGDIVYVELPEVGLKVQAGEELCVIESVKAAADVYAPLAGDVIEVNDNLADSPNLINEDAFDAGWLFKIQLANADDINQLLTADVYHKLIAEQ